MLEHVEQLLGELGGEVEGDEGDPVLDDDFEPCSDEEEDDADAPMEHWPQPLACALRFLFFPHHASLYLKCSNVLSKVPFLLVILSQPFIKDEIWIQVSCTKRVALKAAVYSISFSQLFNAFGEISDCL